MNEKSFLKKLINKYSKKFEISPINGLRLNIKHKETLIKEIDNFLENIEKNEYPKVNYGDSDYINYYKTMCILSWYYTEKYKYYKDLDIYLPNPIK